MPVYFLCGFILDKIAIPDFGTGAMENWGLITYRETNLLYDEQESSSDNKQRVASVIAHELVHQVCSSWRIKEALGMNQWQLTFPGKNLNCQI